MTLVRTLLIAHLAALVFGLAGLLIALPNPHLWAGSPLGIQVFQFGMEHAGALHILFGAATMLALGLRALGRRKTAIFFVASVSISLASELIGTATGWPFGNYAYTEGLGWKVLGRVPYTIPLSWFYMGFASYLLAVAILARWTPPSLTARSRAVSEVALGAWLLLVWDLVLDPAMAHESLPVKFWIWSESGPFFGMPIKNLAAWFATGAIFIGLSRLLWREGVPTPAGAGALAHVSLATYLANHAFAAVLSASVGLWAPIPLAILFGLAPVVVLIALAPGARPRLLRPSTIARS
jgi:putative membrane protein